MTDVQVSGWEPCVTDAICQIQECEQNGMQAYHSDIHYAPEPHQIISVAVNAGFQVCSRQAFLSIPIGTLAVQVLNTCVSFNSALILLQISPCVKADMIYLDVLCIIPIVQSKKKYSNREYFRHIIPSLG